MQVKSLDPGFTDIIVHPQFGKAQKGVRPFSLALPDLAIVILRCHSIRLGHIPTIAKSRHLHGSGAYHRLLRKEKPEDPGEPLSPCQSG